MCTGRNQGKNGGIVYKGVEYNGDDQIPMPNYSQSPSGPPKSLVNQKKNEAKRDDAARFKASNAYRQQTRERESVAEKNRRLREANLAGTPDEGNPYQDPEEYARRNKSGGSLTTFRSSLG